MEAAHNSSIFAHELEQILANHGFTVDDLRRKPFVIDGRKVDALVASLHSLRRMPALNQGEIMTIVLALKLQPQERLQIYAAFIALGAQRLLLDYLSAQRAWEIATEVRNGALTWLQHNRSNEDFIRRIHVGEASLEIFRDQQDAALIQALDMYDEGLTLATLGIFLGSKRGQICLEQALAYFERAESLLQLAQPSEEQLYWANQIKEELNRTRAELG